MSAFYVAIKALYFSGQIGIPALDYYVGKGRISSEDKAALIESANA